MRNHGDTIYDIQAVEKILTSDKQTYEYIVIS